MLLKLVALKFTIRAWKFSIDLSKKLRPRTWVLIALINAVVSATTFYFYKAESVPASSIPQMYDLQVEPVPLPSDLVKVNTEESFVLYPIAQQCRVDVSTLVHIDWPNPLKPAVDVLTLQRLPWDFPHWPERTPPTVVQFPDSETPSLLTTIEKRVALVASVITAIMAIVNLFLALQALRTFKAEKKLKELQLAHLRLEIERLRTEMEDAKREREKSSGIILVS